MMNSIGSFLLSFALTIGLSFLIMKSPIGVHFLEAVTENNEEKWNSNPNVYRTGGMALFPVFLVGFFVFGYHTNPADVFTFLCLSGFFILGIRDDYKRNSSNRMFLTAYDKTRLTLLLSGLVCLTLYGPHVPALKDSWNSFLMFFQGASGLPVSPASFTIFDFALPWVFLSVPVGFVLTLWGYPNLLNLLDGINGLGILFSLLCLIFLGLPQSIPSVHLFWILGCFSGITLLNIMDRQYLGDAGSLFLGSIIAWVALTSINPLHVEDFLFLFAYPIFDTCHVLLLRRRYGHPWNKADKRHFHYFVSRFFGSSIGLILCLLMGMGPMFMIHGPFHNAAYGRVGLAFLFLGIVFSYALQATSPPPPERERR